MGVLVERTSMFPRSGKLLLCSDVSDVFAEASSTSGKGSYSVLCWPSKTCMVAGMMAIMCHVRTKMG